MKHKNRYSGAKQRSFLVQRLPHLVFTIESLSLMKDTFVSFEESLNRQPQSHSKLPFARETFNQVKQKVEEMILLEATGEEILFNGNEIIIIRACLELYFVDLLCMNPTYRRDQLIIQCSNLRGKLPPLPIKLHD